MTEIGHDGREHDGATCRRRRRAHQKSRGRFDLERVADVLIQHAGQFRQLLVCELTDLSGI
jgi:hypothetical protein